MLSNQRTALVTGGGGGIGRELCRDLVARGFRVVAIGAHADELIALNKELPSIETHVIDLTAPDACHTLEQNYADSTDLLINCAGVGLWGSHVDLAPDRIRSMIQLNVGALCELCTRFGRRMQLRGRGSILNVASTASFHPCPWLSAYAATKHFVTAFSLALSDELRPHGVNVAVLCPGITRTPFLSRVGFHEGMPFSRAVAALSLSPSQVASEGLARFFEGETYVVPGALNRAHRVLSTLLPRQVAAQVFGRLGRRDAQRPSAESSAPR